MGRKAHKLGALVLACTLVISAAIPSVSLAAIPGAYYSVAVWPNTPGSFTAPSDVSVSASGEVYIADTANCRIKRMSSGGALISVWGSRGTGAGQFSDPRGVAVLPSGRVLVADTGNNRLQLFEANGTYVATWGGPGTGNLQFSAPSGLGVDAAGNAYVADAGNGRIQKVSSAGVYLATIGAYGPGNGQLDNPRDVAVDAAGNIYVADTNNRRIEKFTSAGAYTTYWGPVEISGTTYSRYSAPSGISIDSAGYVWVVDPGRAWVSPADPLSVRYYIERCSNTGAAPLLQWGADGTASGQYKGARGIAARPGGGVYVADTDNNRVQVLSATGVVDAIWTGRGTALGALDSPQGVALDAAGQAYVADTLNNRVQVFDSAGAFVRSFGSAGSAAGQFNAPTDVAIAPGGNVLVVDKGNNRVQTFDATGTYVSSFGSAGSGNTQFSAPEGIGVDASGNVFVADTGNARIQKFSSAWVYALSMGTGGVLAAPTDVAVDAADNVYAVDRTAARVRVFTSAGVLLRTIGASGINDGQFFQPTGVAVSGSSIFVTDSGNSRIQRLTTTGTFETKFGTFGGGAGELSWPSRAAVDSLGRVLVAERDNHRLQMFAYDVTAPATALSGFVNNMTYSTPVTMTLSPTDTGSGVAVTYYTINGSTPATVYNGPVSISAEGLSTIVYWSVDRVGNTEGSKLARVTIDRTPPSGGLMVAGGAEYVATTTVQAVSTFSDAVDMRFNTDGSWPPSYRAFEGLVSLTLPGEGVHVVRAEYRDFAGNVASRQDTVTVDLTSPTSAAVVSPADWTNAPATVSISATDTASGLQLIRYRVGPSGEETTYAGPFQIADEGVTEVTYFSVDNLGNTEATHAVFAYIDLTPPTGTLVIAGGASLVDTATVSLASDVPDAVDMRIDPGHGFGAWITYDPLVDATVPHEGTSPIQVEYRDRAGNTLLLGGTLDVDLAAPTTVVSGIPGGEASGPVTVTLTATDTVSGVEATFYQLDSGPVETYEAPFVVSKEGTTTVTYWSRDVAGRSEEPTSTRVRIDTTAPVGTFVLDGGATYALSETVSADSAFTDADEMSFDTGAGYGSWYAYAPAHSLHVSGEGAHTVEASFRDAVGNVRILEDSIFVDLAAPETVATLETTEWSPEPVTVTLAADDTGSGVFAIYYRIGSELSTYTAPFEVDAEGETTVEYWSVDQAGRVEDTASALVRIDTIAPTGTMRLARGANYALVHTVQLDSLVPGATEMQIDKGAGFGTWVEYAGSSVVTLAADGFYTVRVRYRDVAGNTLVLSDTVTLDTRAPIVTGATLTVDSWRRPKQPTGTVRATWSATDANPVVGYSYVIDRAETTVPDTVIDTARTSLRTTVPVHGTWYFHLRAKDAAGRWSTTRTVRFVVSTRRSYGRVFR